MNKHVLLLAVALWVLTLVACQATPTSTTAPTSAPTVTSTPTSTATPTPTNTATSTPTNTSTPKPPTSTLTPTPAPINATVMAEVLNLRTGPGVGYAIIGQLQQGDVATVIAQNLGGNWLKVEHEGSTGWVSTKYVDVPTEVAMVPTAKAPPTETPTNTPSPEPTATPTPTSTAEPGPSGEVDTGMGGNLSIQGVVKDSFGNVAPYVYVALQAYGEKGGWIVGKLGEWRLYTDETGFYSFNNLLRAPGGHYQLFFNVFHQYGEVYEESEGWINENEISGDVYIFNVTVHPVTGSALHAVIQYEDVDGSIKAFVSPFARPDRPKDHYIELWRGTPDNVEYPIGTPYCTFVGSTAKWDGLAGGTYFLQFTYRRPDGVLLRCRSPSFEIPPGETKQFEYTIRNCPPMPGPLFP